MEAYDLKIYLTSRFIGEASRMAYQEYLSYKDMLRKHYVDVVFWEDKALITHIGQRTKKLPAKVKTLAQAVKWCIERTKKENF